MSEKMMFGSQGVDPCAECPEKDSFIGVKCRQIVGDACPKYVLGESYHTESLGLSVIVRDGYVESDEVEQQHDRTTDVAPSVKIPLNAQNVITKYL